MKKLSLTNLAQDQIKKEEADQIKGGICYCTCSCTCPVEYRIDYRMDDRFFARSEIA